MNCPASVRGEASKLAGMLPIIPSDDFSSQFLYLPTKGLNPFGIFYLYGFCSLPTEAKTGFFFAVTPFLPTPRIWIVESLLFLCHSSAYSFEKE